jgi:hypothetical protein
MRPGSPSTCLMALEPSPSSAIRPAIRWAWTPERPFRRQRPRPSDDPARSGTPVHG